MNASKIFVFAALLSVSLLAGACILSTSDDIMPPEGPEKPVEEPESRKDTLAQTIWFSSPEHAFSGLDVFVYDKTLVLHRRVNGQDSLHITLEKDMEYTIVAIANAIGEFNEKALQHYDAWAAFEVILSGENPEYPMMGAIKKVKAGSESKSEIELTSLLCTIEIRSVTQLISDTALIENPRVHLANRSTKARLLSTENIAPSEQKDGETIFLPYDIGVYTQYPGVKLYAYPHEVPSTPTSPATELVLEYELDGITREYRQTVHPLRRGCYEMIDIEIR